MNADQRPRPQVSMPVNSHEDEKHLIDYLRVLYKRRWVAIPTFLVILVVGVINTYRTTPIYEAHAQILIEKDSPRVAGLNDIFTQQDGWYNDEFYQTQYRILQSRSLARKAVKTMQLGAHPAYKRMISTPPPMTLTGAATAAYSTVKTAIVGAAPSAAPRETIPQPTASGETTQEAALVDSFLGALTVVPVRNSRLVELRFTSSEPQLAADMANALAKTYIEQNIEFKFNSSKDAADWLSGQMAEQRKKVEESEAQLQRYKEQHDAVAVEDRQNIVVQRLGEMNAAVTKAKTTRIKKEALYNQLKAMQTSGSIDSFPPCSRTNTCRRSRATSATSSASRRSWRRGTATATRR